MSHNNNTKTSAGLKLITLAVCILLPLGVSGMHGGMFLKMLGGEGSNGYVMLAMACCFVFSMPIISTHVGQAFDNDKTNLGVAGIFACVALMAFSNISSTLALHGTSGATISKQVNESTEVITYREMVYANNKTIEGLQAQIDGRDAVKWAGKRDGWAQNISQLQNKNVAIMSEIKSLKDEGNGSSVAQAFIAMEEYGITLFGLSALAAALLDIVPFIAGLMLGSNGRRYVAEVVAESGERVSVKKHQPDLKVVG